MSRKLCKDCAYCKVFNECSGIGVGEASSMCCFEVAEVRRHAELPACCHFAGVEDAADAPLSKQINMLTRNIRNVGLTEGFEDLRKSCHEFVSEFDGAASSK